MISGSLARNRNFFALLLLLMSGMITWADDGLHVAAMLGKAQPANQLLVSGNACGPTSLLNSFRFGNQDWQRALLAVSGENDKQRIFTIIREIGMRPSKHLTGRPRWSRKGINIADLCDMGNEMTRGQMLPIISQEVFIAKAREGQQALLSRVHQRLARSLQKGLPPIVSLRRYVLRASGGNQTPQWVVLEAHFITLVSLPKKLERGARSFAVQYIDPWGGKMHQGEIAIPEQAVLTELGTPSPCLIAQFPNLSVGRKLVKKGEVSYVVVSAGLGRW